ncbi:hypothetical protein C4585_01540 [Candidatus Parcubacteria bacterium]|nr:MAG: hypothetical protein C4585_01540 [Candidatus Parcubacteria bacterium]
MSIILEPNTTPSPRNTVEEIYSFARLNADIIQPSEVERSLIDAAEEIEFLSPIVADSDRSLRSEGLRKRAEANFTTASLYEIIATNVALTTPPKQILNALNLSIGADFPTPDIVQVAFEKASDRYRTEGIRLLNMIRPITASIEAGKSIDE